MTYYIDENNKLYEKSGIDFRVKKGLQTLEGLRVATDEEAEAVLNPEQTVEQRQSLAKITRDNAVNANIIVHNADWQVANDAEDIRKVIGDAETIVASEDDTTMFRLADNSWRETTLSELRDVLKAHIARKQDVWNQMAVWESGDKQSEFVVE